MPHGLRAGRSATAGDETPTTIMGVEFSSAVRDGRVGGADGGWDAGAGGRGEVQGSLGGGEFKELAYRPAAEGNWTSSLPGRRRREPGGARVQDCGVGNLELACSDWELGKAAAALVAKLWMD